jgi:protein TonB
MASPAELANVLPDTLPDDFGEWDSGDSPGVKPAEPGPGASPEPLTPPAEARAAAALRLAPAPVRAQEQAFSQQKRIMDAVAAAPPRKPAVSRAVEEMPVRPVRSTVAAPEAPRSVPSPEAAMSEADEVLFHSFRSSSASEEEPEPANNRVKMFSAIGAGAVVLLSAILIPVFLHGKSTGAKASLEQPQPTITVVNPPDTSANALKPSPSTTLGGSKTAAPADAQPATDDTASNDAAQPTPAPVQSQMMNDQLAAPAHITQAMKQKPVEDAPPPSAGIGAAGMEALGGTANGNVFGGARLNVKSAPPKIVTVSSGVAVGLLLSKTPPTYPQIARTARVSGTVVLQATISKTGAIENLHAVSGPVMLRQAAVDAVRTWRYAPYKLNNEPTEIETTINVIFSLAG